MQDPLVVTFDSPHSGSLCAHLVTGTVTATIGASYIPNDFLEDLVRALLNVTLRTGTFNAVANDEPNIQNAFSSSPPDSASIFVCGMALIRNTSR